MESDQEFDVLSFITNMSLANGNDKALRNGTFKFSWVSLEPLTCKAQRMYFQSQYIKEAFRCYDGFRKYFKQSFDSQHEKFC